MSDEVRIQISKLGKTSFFSVTRIVFAQLEGETLSVDLIGGEHLFSRLLQTFLYQ